MIELKSTPGEVHFTITVKRAETGKEETYDVIGTLINNEELENGSNTFDSSEGCSN